MTQARILLVEDESILRMDLKEMLIEAGYEIAGEAGDGEKAIELAHTTNPDLIIMDVKMPGMNGLKASKIITRSINVPVLILTAYSQRDLIEEAKHANIIGYLVKPIRESNLIPSIEIALSQAERFSTLKRDIHALEKKLQSRKTIEKAKGILMKRDHITEEQAYHTLRRKSMNEGIPIEIIAQEILNESTKINT